MEPDTEWIGSSNFWIDLLRDGIFLAEINTDQARSLFLHLADLGVFESGEEDLWVLQHPETINTPPAAKSFIEKRLAELAQTEKGFAIEYFLAGSSQISKEVSRAPEKDSDSESQNKKEFFSSSKKSMPAKTSDPSTLQIVKKYGRQIQSFMELEQDMVSRLMGKHTTKSDARRIFNFVLGKMKVKTQPRPWEQLSRRRHK